MDLGWVATYGSRQKMEVHISFMFEADSVPDLSIEVGRRGGVRERANIVLSANRARAILWLGGLARSGLSQILARLGGNRL